MHTVATRPAPIDVVSNPRPHQVRRGRAGLELLVTAITPLAALGALIILGMSAAVAVCSVFVATFSVTTVMDIRWLRQTRRSFLDREVGATG